MSGARSLRRWFDDSRFARLWTDAGMLFASLLAVAGMDLACMAITARALGPEGFGSLVLIQTYVVVVDTLFNFQAGQAITRYGAGALVAGRADRLRGLFKLGRLLDASSGVLGTAVAWAGLSWMAAWQGWSADQETLAGWACLAILLNWSATPTALLGLFRRFRWLAAARGGVALLRLLAVIAVWRGGGGLPAFLGVWVASYVLQNLLLMALGSFALRREGFARRGSASIRDFVRAQPGVWRFVATTNLSSTIRLGAQEVDVLVVGALLGPGPTGIYQVAKRLGSLPAYLGGPIQESVYPEMARLWSAGAVEDFRRLIVRVGTLAGLAGLVTWVCWWIIAEPVVVATAGAAFAAATLPLLVYMGSNVLYLFGVTFRPAMLSFERPGVILSIYALGHIVYFAVLFALLEPFGIVGAAIAQLVFYAAWFAAMAGCIVALLGRRAAEDAP